MRHETVQVACKASGFEVGLLGILNGIFGVSSEKMYGYIAARYDHAGQLLDFELVEPRPILSTS